MKSVHGTGGGPSQCSPPLLPPISMSVSLIAECDHIATVLVRAFSNPGNVGLLCYLNYDGINVHSSQIGLGLC